MTQLSVRRSPDTIAFEVVDVVVQKGEASKWDLIKVLGNDTQFRLWVEDFLLKEKFIDVDIAMQGSLPYIHYGTGASALRM